MRIKKLNILSFRGIKGPLELNLDENGLVIQGSNGDGKSCLVDAIQWVIWGEIPHVTEPEFASRSDLHFCVCESLEPVDVSLTLKDKAKDYLLTRKMLPGKPPSIGGIVPDNLKFLFPDNMILRRSELSNFVNYTKQKKLEALEKLFGMEELYNAFAEIQAAANALSKDPTFIKSQTLHRNSAEALRKITESEEINESSIIKKASQLAAEAQLNMKVEILNDVFSVRDKARDYIKLSPEIASVAKLQETLNFALSRVPSLKALAKIKEARMKFSSERISREAKAFREIKSRALEFSKQGIWTEKFCPLCGLPISDLTELLEKLKQEIIELDLLVGDFDKMEAEIYSEMQKVSDLKNSLEKLLSPDLRKLDAVKQRDNEILLSIAAAQTLEDRLRMMLDKPEHLVEDNLDFNWLESMAKSLQEATQETSLAAEKIALSQEAKDRIDKARKLEEITTRYEEFIENSAIAAPYTRQQESLRAVLTKLNEYEDSILVAKLDQLSGRVNEFFQTLHPDEGVIDLRIETTSEEGTRGAEFHANFHGKDLIAPKRILSEGHLHSLGLCLFLANAEQVLQDMRVLVLDDVVTSLDAEHRGRVADLLARAFDKWQILALTHDPIWTDHLRTKCNLIVKVLQPWQSVSGAVLLDDPGPHLTRAKDCLTRGDKQGASAFLRDYFEHELKIVAEALQAKLVLQFGVNNEKRMLRELISATQSALNKLKPKGTLIENLGEFSKDAWIINILSHDPGDSISVTSITELKDALKKFTKFISSLQCPKCNCRPNYRYSNDRKGPAQCKCGPMNSVEFGTS